MNEIIKQADKTDTVFRNFSIASSVILGVIEAFIIYDKEPVIGQILVGQGLVVFLLQDLLCEL